MDYIKIHIICALVMIAATGFWYGYKQSLEAREVFGIMIFSIVFGPAALVIGSFTKIGEYARKRKHKENT